MNSKQDNKHCALVDSLITIWGKVLQDVSIDRRSHFFDSGGDSLAATAMCTEVEQRAGCAIPVGQIYLTPILEDFAAELSRYDRNDCTPLFVPLKKEGNGYPLFAVTPAQGGVFHFLQQVETLGGDYPFFGIEPRISASGSHAYSSIRDLAIYSLAVVRNKQPQGPYRFVGYSFGGTVAWEMARILEEEGETVDLLVLLDSSNRNGYRFAGERPSLIKRIFYEWKFYGECRRVRKLYDEPFNYLRWIPLIRKKISDSITHFGGSAHARNTSVAEDAPGAEEMIVESQRNLRDGYDAGKYRGKVHLFRAKQQLTLHRELDYDLGWTPCLNHGNLFIKTVPGDHFSFMNPPHVEVIGSAISSLIQNANSKICHKIDSEVNLAGTLKPITLDEPIHGESLTDRFLAIVKAYPQHTAIRDGGMILSYKQFHGIAEKICGFILENYPDSSTPVLLHFETSWQFVCTIYGVLLAGRCYVPVDPEFPDLRIVEIIKHSGCKVVISATPRRLSPEIADVLEVIPFNRASRHIPSEEKALPKGVPPESPAVLLFTSGSTGHPKGTTVSRKMLLHVAWRRGTTCGFCPKDRYAITYTSAFMGALMALHCPILCGSTISIYNLRKRGLADLPTWLASERISIIHMITSILRRLLGYWKGAPSLPHLRLLIPGGEKVRKSDIEQWKQVCAPAVQFATCLGSTECGTIAMWPHEMDFQPASGPIPVGVPFKSLNAKIIREDGSTASANEEGELVVESEYIFTGYLNADSLNQSVVSYAPDRKTTYKTGDYGYIDENGILYNAGRRDSRVKINGNLIELSEIESTLMSSGLIDEVAVIFRPITRSEKERRLVAFYRARNSDTPEQEMINYLMKRLPRYMIPVRWIRLNVLPETANGKTNRSMLQQMDLINPDIRESNNVPV